MTKIITFPAKGDLQRDICRVSKSTSLSRSEVIRQSIRLGLPAFRQRFPTSPKNRPNKTGK